MSKIYDSPECSNLKHVSEFDAICDSLQNEVNRYRNNLESLIDKLQDSTKVACEPKCVNEGTPVVTTVQGAIREEIDKLARCNELFQVTLKRIEEQVGELKILP